MKKIITYFKNAISNQKVKDIIVLSIIIIVYSIVSFINLGSFSNPQTFSDIYSNKGVTFELEKENVSKIRYFVGDREGSFKAYGSTDGISFSELGQMKGDVLTWNDFQIDRSIKYLNIIGDNYGMLGEIQVYDKFFNKIKAVGLSEGSEKLIDEPGTVPEEISYKNSAYFDEIYFATSAYEYANGKLATEWTHPHLGKIIQSIPVLVFGMNPFTYRLMGNIAGILMIIVMYMFGKIIFKNSRYGYIAAILMACDNFHFAQTRMGTVDSFLVLFCMISTYFMYKFLIQDNTETLRKKLKNLFWCGLFFGFAVSVKWSAMYTGLGLAILLFSKIIYETIKNQKFNKQYLIILTSCVLFFVVIPLIIYITCYFSFQTVYGEVKDISQLMKHTQDIYNFHSTLDATHPFSSEWYTWPIMLRPVWYYVSQVNSAITSTICGIGNPAIWWFGIIALFYVLISALIKRNKENIFIIIMYLAVWLPYVIISRLMFLYHYFMALPFVMLAIVSFLRFMENKFNKKWIVPTYLLIVLLLFWIFYPVVSGVPTPKTYIDSLHWFPTWIF